MSQIHSPRSREGPIIHTGHKERVYSVAFSPDGKSVVSGSWDHTVRIWDSHSASQVSKLLKGHTGWIFSVSYSPLGNLIASGSRDKSIRIWNANTSHQVGQPLWGHNGDVNSVSFSPDANLLTSGSDDKTIRLWHAQNRSSASSPFRGHSDWVRSVAFSPEGTRIVSGSGDKTIRIWDVERGTTVLGPLEGHTGVVCSVAFSPDGTQIVSGSFDDSLQLWDSRTGRVIGKPYEGHAKDINSVSFSPNGRHVISASDDQTVRLWDVRTGGQINEPFKQHSSSVYSVAFSTSGARIVSGSGDQSVMIWNLSSGDLELETHIHLPTKNNATDSAAESGKNPSGQQVATEQIFDQLLSYGCVNLSAQIDSRKDSPFILRGIGVGNIGIVKLHSGTRAIIKAWQAHLIEQCDSKALESATKEIQIWSKMKHKNIHQLMGVIMSSSQYLGFVLEEMENGNLHEYMRKNPRLDRRRMCIQVTLGLTYMHQHDMVHGDLRAHNVLVTSSGVPKLSNFGLSAISEACLPFSDKSSSQTESVRWVAPELLAVGASKTKQSDIYALGMTMLVRGPRGSIPKPLANSAQEVLTGNIPYPQCRWDFQVLGQIMQGELPTRPAVLKDDEYENQLWGLLLKCWHKEPSSRPSAIELLGLLVLISTDLEFVQA